MMQWCFVTFFLSLATFGHCLPQKLGLSISASASAAVPPRAVVSGDPLICLLCMDVVHKAQEAVEKPSVQKNVLDGFLNGLCPLFPGAAVEKCQKMVKVYTPVVFDVVEKNLDPKLFCQDISLCPDYQVPPPEQKSAADMALLSASLLSSLLGSPPQAASSSLPCDVCTFMVHELADKLKSNKTQKKVIHVMDKVCRGLPYDVQEECLWFMNKFLTMIIKMAVDDLIQPQQVCASLNICPSKMIPVLFKGKSRTGENYPQVADRDHSLRFQTRK